MTPSTLSPKRNDRVIRRKSAPAQQGKRESQNTTSPESVSQKTAESDENPAVGENGVDDATVQGGRWRLRNWRLRTKLLVVLLIPTLAVLVFVGMRVQGDLVNASELSELDAQVQLEQSAAEAVHELQRERDLTVRFVAVRRPGQEPELQAQREKVDTAVTAFHGQREAADSELSPAAADRFRQVSERFDRLGAVRSTVDESSYPDDAIMRAYNELVQGVHDVSDQSVADIQDPELSRFYLATNAIARAAEQESRKRALLLAGLERDELELAERRTLQAADAEFDAATSDFRKFANPEQRRMYDDTVMGLVVDVGNGIESQATAQAERGRSLGGIDVERWDTASTYTLNRINEVHEALLNQTREHTESLVAQSRDSVIRDTAITGGILLAALLFALIIARSVLRPLRVLRTTALDVAGYRLPEEVDDILADQDPEHRSTIAPEPVPVHSGEEVGQLARAFDAVHSEAIRLAAEQALLRDNVNAMFVNLSRRSQALVERQLGVLDRMESDEQDPDQLASLFELDHMATRMRRNSENLLVLAGSELGRQVTEPIAVSEVIGAAVSEIEQYARIEVAPTPQRLIAGNAVNDVVHVISELLDNATAFSDPASKVSVDTTSTRTGGLRLEIADRGVGMPDEDIAATNERLANPPEVDASVARRMGLYVVGRLAQRHQIRVRLRKGDHGGITAGVLVPPELVSDMVIESPRPKPARSEPTRPAFDKPTEPAGWEFDAPSTSGLTDSTQALPTRTPRSQRHSEPRWPAFPPAEHTGTEAAEPVSPERYEPRWPAEPQPGAAEEPDLPADLGPPARQPVTGRPNGLFDAGPEPEPEDELSPLDADAPTIRMPIYEAVLSKWFNDSTANGMNSTEPANGLGSNGDAATSQWHTPADAGWQAALGLEGGTSAPSSQTAAGLPKRVPKARLVPGSATEESEEEQPTVLPKSAEATRGRMSSLQQGVRRGRHALRREYPDGEQDGPHPGAEPGEGSEEGL
ncbi:MAG: HAMP domain-containing protein [Pseudonocardiaceae bacterium]|nr:HAMP domain-containing protein [Pseudonocardiaceae bacterium]